MSGTQGVKLPNLTLLKQTGNKQAISAFHISQTAPIKTRSDFWPREQSEWKKKTKTFKTENSSGLWDFTLRDWTERILVEAVEITVNLDHNV